MAILRTVRWSRHGRTAEREFQRSGQARSTTPRADRSSRFPCGRAALSKGSADRSRTARRPFVASVRVFLMVSPIELMSKLLTFSSRASAAEKPRPAKMSPLPCSTGMSSMVSPPLPKLSRVSAAPRSGRARTGRGRAMDQGFERSMRDVFCFRTIDTPTGYRGFRSECFGQASPNRDGTACPDHRSRHYARTGGRTSRMSIRIRLVGRWTCRAMTVKREYPSPAGPHSDAHADKPCHDEGGAGPMQPDRKLLWSRHRRASRRADHPRHRENHQHDHPGNNREPCAGRGQCAGAGPECR